MVDNPKALLEKLEKPLRFLGPHVAEEPYFYTVLCRMMTSFLSDVCSFRCNMI